MRSDALLLLGLGALVYGVSLLSAAGGWVVGGGLLAAIGVLDGIRSRRKEDGGGSGR